MQNSSKTSNLLDLVSRVIENDTWESSKVYLFFRYLLDLKKCFVKKNFFFMIWQCKPALHHKTVVYGFMVRALLHITLVWLASQIHVSLSNEKILVEVKLW